MWKNIFSFQLEVRGRMMKAVVARKLASPESIDIISTQTPWTRIYLSSLNEARRLYRFV
jgi:hypothetical protein